MKRTIIKPKGIGLRFVNTFFTSITLIVFIFILIISARVNARFHAVTRAMEKFITCQQSSEQIKESSNFLTDQARLFAVTHKQEYVDAYLKELNETKRQQHAIEQLETVCSKSDIALQRLRIAIEQGESLINMELYAMRLVYESANIPNMPSRIASIPIGALDRSDSKEKLRQTAVNNLFGDGYLIYKMRINENCKLTVSTIEQQIKDDLHMNATELGININRLRLLFFTLLVINLFLFIVFAYLIMIPLHTFQSAIRKDEKLSVIGALEFRNLAKSYNEIYEIKAQNERSLLKKAEYDGLTGILNRRAFDEICETSREKMQRIALLLIDMDNFKQVNDNYGHAGGDTVLKELARQLTEKFRSGDYISRIGGDEFAVILPNFKPEAATLIQRKIRQINAELGSMKGIANVSISAGLAFSENGYSQSLYENADKALYHVKEKGKCGCEIFKENRAQSE
ncbi:MAG: GGDEF domain-containing protein [Treponema sp.]|nr:GGDEF domain-containing protein [Treponema sp.]